MQTRISLFRMISLISPAMSLALAAGCGTSVPSNPTTYPVRGKVTLDGGPLKQGFVRFDPAEPGKGLPAEGEIKPDGTYEARAFVGQPGTTPGDYKVSIAAIPRAQEGEAVGGAITVPSKYQRPDTSDVTKTIVSGENTIDVQLVSR